MFRVRFAGCVAAAVTCAAGLAWAAADKDPPATPTKNSADGLVQSAIQAEAQADLARRKELLGEALEADQGNAAAHWQLGQVLFQGQWLSVEEVAARAGRDKALADYRQMRKKFGDSEQAQRILARWCQENELANPARAHASRLHEMQPQDAEALKILGLSWYQGMLLTPEQIALRKNHDEKAKEALVHWKPLILDMRRKMDSKDAGVSGEGWQALRAIQDPSAIEALETVFSKSRHDESLEVVKVIGRMNTPAATDSLLRHALLSKWEDVRLAACDQLRQRSAVGYVPKLISALTYPVESNFEVVRDGDTVAFRETVERQDLEGKQREVVETRVPLYIPNPNLAAIVNTAAMEAFAHAQNTAATLEGNKRVKRSQQQMNKEIYGLLEKTTGQKLAQHPDSWNAWWRQQNYMLTSTKPTETYTYPRFVDVPYVPYIPPSIPIYGGGPIASAFPPPPPPPLPPHQCFALGTKVWAIDGSVAIERVQVGDQVLSQDPFTGELTYKPVLRTTAGNTDLLAIDLGNEKIKATPGHVFWVSGSGWRMAADLKAGDRLHSVNGWSDVAGLTSVPAAETRNLIVADFGTYFVGDNRLLVHDVTMLQPYAGKVPGDRPDEAEELAAK